MTRLLLLAVLAVAPSVARADEPPAEERVDADEIVPDGKARRMAAEANLEPVRRREGLALGVALGPSLQIGVGEALEEATGTGGSLDLRIGNSASDRLAWFVDLFVAAAPREDDASAVNINRTTTLTGGLQVFVLEALWLRGGLGLATLDLKSELMPEKRSHSGLGGIAGGGIDVLRRGRFALSGDLTFVSGLYKGGFVTALVAQLGLTWY